jgi:hypothetical protein
VNAVIQGLTNAYTEFLAEWYLVLCVIWPYNSSSEAEIRQDAIMLAAKSISVFNKF